MKIPGFQKPDVPAPPSVRATGTQVEDDLDEEESSVEAYDGSDNDSDITNRSNFVTVDDLINHPDQPVAVFLPAGRVTVDPNTEDGIPRRSVLTRPRAPFTQNEIERRMPPGTRLYLRRMSKVVPQELQDAFDTLGEQVSLSLISELTEFLLSPKQP